MFRRRRNDEAELDELGDDLENEELDGADGAPDPVLPAPLVRPAGPWDFDDLPDDGVERIDLGGLLVPVVGGHELRVDVDQTTGQVTSVTLATPTSVMQVFAYAAPRTAGIWVEVREEIAAAVTAGGGSTEEADGPHGRELRAHVPTDVPGQLAPARFVGVDGPRWFLRAMVQGQAAVDPDADMLLFDALKGVAVRRGGDAMAVRDPLPMRLPADIAPVVPPEAEPAPPSLGLPERGPEITETR